MSLHHDAASASAGHAQRVKPRRRAGRRGGRGGGGGGGGQIWRPTQEVAGAASSVAAQEDGTSELADEAARQTANEGAGAAAAQVPFQLATPAAETAHEQPSQGRRQKSFAVEAKRHAQAITEIYFKDGREQALTHFAAQRISLLTRQQIALEWWKECYEDILLQIVAAYLIKKSPEVAEEKEGSRFLQDMIRDKNQLGKDYREGLPQALAAKCVGLCKHKEGNFVMSTLIQEVPMQAATAAGRSRMQPITDAIVQHGPEIARDKYGCRVLQELIRHCSEEDKKRLFAMLKDHVVWVVTSNSTESSDDGGKVLDGLAVHKFGNYVLTTLFEHGPEDVKNALAASMVEMVIYIAQDQYGTYVVQEAFKFLTDEEVRNELADPLRHHHRDLHGRRHSSFVIAKMKELGILQT
mmetsp:Transcript_13758/g.25199  ORF Transcript_13758/g.25199 Transcript_13758/m.25199 type:complete len:410 (+) Transcript_13758:170-1399(+)